MSISDVEPRRFVDLRDEWNSLADRTGSRLVDRVEFVFGTEHPDQVLDELQDEFKGARVGAYRGGLGRGAEGPALVLHVLDVTTDVLSGVVSWATAGAGAVAVWKRLVTKKGPPTLSLGALKLLCAVDLSGRVSKMKGIQCVYAGDIGRGRDHDLGHTGEDTFMVMFERRDESWIYIVSSKGEVVHRSTGKYVPNQLLLDMKRDP